MLTASLSLLLAITPAITHNASGTMVVWGEQSRIHANEVLVAPESPNAQSTPDVAALDDLFYVVWSEGSRAYGRVVFDGRTLGPITDLGVAYTTGAPVTPQHDAQYWAKLTQDMDFSEADRVPTAKFNKILWRGLMGAKPYPDLKRFIAQRVATKVRVDND